MTSSFYSVFSIGGHCAITQYLSVVSVEGHIAIS
jgi:hypothetical protein